MLRKNAENFVGVIKYKPCPELAIKGPGDITIGEKFLFDMEVRNGKILFKKREMQKKTKKGQIGLLTPRNLTSLPDRHHIHEELTSLSAVGSATEDNVMSHC